MKIIIAPDSFKESLSASAVADAIERGLRRALPDAEYVKLPIADGGEGTVDALINATAGQLIFVPVTGPMGRPVNGFFGLLGDGKTAVIEVAAALRFAVGGAAGEGPADSDQLWGRGAHSRGAGSRGRQNHYWSGRQRHQ